MNLKTFNQNHTDHYHELLQSLVIGDGVRIAHLFVRDEGTPKGGVTIAYRAMHPEMANCRNFQVTAIYCSKHDVFSKKVGNYLALDAFDRGQFTNFNIGDTPTDHVGSYFKYVFGVAISDGTMR